MTSTALWMRWLDFGRLRDLFWLVAERDGLLRPADLNEVGVSAGVLVGERRGRFRPTTHYHYRRTLERLELVRLREGRYFVNRERPAVASLLAVPHHDSALTNAERAAFATLVVQNTDCYEALLGLFVDPSARPTDVESFISLAAPVSVRVERGREPRYASDVVLLRSLETNREAAYRGGAAVQAILWALIPWCVRQLTFLDEVVSIDGRHVLFARDIAQDQPPSVAAQRILEFVEFGSPWMTVRVEDLILGAGQRWRLSAESVRQGLLWLVQRYPGFVAPVSTSKEFVLGRLHRSQQAAALNSYLRLPSGQIVSHLRFSSKIVARAAG